MLWRDYWRPIRYMGSLVCAVPKSLFAFKWNYTSNGLVSSGQVWSARGLARGTGKSTPQLKASRRRRLPGLPIFVPLSFFYKVTTSLAQSTHLPAHCKGNVSNHSSTVGKLIIIKLSLGCVVATWGMNKAHCPTLHFSDLRHWESQKFSTPFCSFFPERRNAINCKG